MRKFLGAFLAATLGFGGAAVAQDPPKHFSNQWEVGYYDADGNATTALGGAEQVAFVRGPKEIVLEIGCRTGDQDGLFYRIGSRSAENKQFAGEGFTPTVTIRDAGQVRFEKELVTNKYFPREFYQGPVIQAFQDGLKGGDRIVFNDKAKEVFFTFSLAGSSKAISSLPCM
ncbi:hypothetical protein [Algicella marina]|uniref:Uncharacterized protein n=1 Tax=Algicella marina TaxID=2683284 RepID=A0A6P1SYX5_9RHOB|nr:hypothetical protein [Algicella marina]QHQ34219.1 hypothetical protein GO499_02945 [Algicella marina]